MANIKKLNTIARKYQQEEETQLALNVNATVDGSRFLVFSNRSLVVCS